MGGILQSGRTQPWWLTNRTSVLQHPPSDTDLSHSFVRAQRACKRGVWCGFSDGFSHRSSQISAKSGMMMSDVGVLTSCCFWDKCCYAAAIILGKIFRKNAYQIFLTYLHSVEQTFGLCSLAPNFNWKTFFFCSCVFVLPANQSPIYLQIETSE